MERTVDLEKLRAVALMYISEELAQDMVNQPEVRATWDYVAKNIGLMVRMHILGREMERVECRWPVDWWQAFKERWFPAWAKERWPVREEVRYLVARELYPKVKLPEKEPAIALRVE